MICICIIITMLLLLIMKVVTVGNADAFNRCLLSFHRSNLIVMLHADRLICRYFLAFKPFTRGDYPPLANMEHPSISLFTWSTHFGIIITYNHPLQQVPIITIMPLIIITRVGRYSCSWSVEKSALVDDIVYVWLGQRQIGLVSQHALLLPWRIQLSQLIQMCNCIFKLTFFRSTDYTVNQAELKTEANCRQMDGRIIMLPYSSLSLALLRLLHCNRHACVLTINKTWYFGGFETSICSNSKAREGVRAKEW